MTADVERLSFQLQEIVDRQQITEALYIYCRAVDRVDRELGYSIWNVGAQVDYGEAIFIGTARGVIDHICDSHLKGIAHSHQIANIIIKLDGDRALSEAYVNSAMRMTSGTQLVQINTRGRYLDTWSRCNGRWGIDRRVFVADLNEVRSVEAGPVPPSLRLDRTDPSYAHFAGDL
jgi:hypothetical protein